MKFKVPSYFCLFYYLIFNLLVIKGLSDSTKAPFAPFYPVSQGKVEK